MPGLRKTFPGPYFQRTLTKNKYNFQVDYCGTLIPQDAKKHAQQYTLRPINSHLYLVHVKHSMALYNVQGVSARHRAGQEAREGGAGLTCGGA